MNPKSNYREQLINKSLINKKKFIVNENSINNQNPIIVNPPKLKKEIQKKSNKNEINYHLDSLKETIHTEKEDTVFVCIYTIQTEKSINPYLLYLLYNDNEKFIHTKFLEWYDDKSKKNKYKIAIDKFEQYLEQSSNQDLIQSIKKELKLLCYNIKNKVNTKNSGYIVSEVIE